MNDLNLFSWTYSDGSNGSGDMLPDDEDELVRIRELVLQYNKTRWLMDGLRNHMSHPIHERAMDGGIPPNLAILRANNCKLRTFPVLPKSIHELYMCQNRFLHLPDLSMFANLIVLELEDNCIDSIVNPLPPNLVRLNLTTNAIRKFDLRLVEHLAETDICTHSNPYDPFPIVRQTLQPRIIHTPMEPLPAKTRTIYENTQNVHASGVQSSVRKNIQWIVNYRQEIPANTNVYGDINNAFLKPCSLISRTFQTIRGDKPPGSILKSFVTDDNFMYTMNGVSMFTLIDRIWLRICDTKDNARKKELQQRLFEEVIDGNGKCKNGMMVRLANVFVGFEEACSITLSPNEILGGRIPATIKRLRAEMGEEESTAFYMAAYKETVKDLNDVNLPDEQWRVWLEGFAEPVLDELWESHHDWKNTSRKDCPESDKIREVIVGTGLNGYSWEVGYIHSKWVMT